MADVADASARLERYKTGGGEQAGARRGLLREWLRHDVGKDALRVPAGHARRDDVCRVYQLLWLNKVS